MQSYFGNREVPDAYSIVWKTGQEVRWWLALIISAGMSENIEAYSRIGGKPVIEYALQF